MHVKAAGILILSRYWECQLCAQQYPHAHGTRNAGKHLNVYRFLYAVTYFYISLVYIS